MRQRVLGWFAAAAFLASASLAGSAPKPVFRSDGISFEAQSAVYESAALTVFGPWGEQFTTVFGSDEALTLSLEDAEGFALPDGVYKFELRLTPSIDSETYSRMQDARESGDETIVAVLRAEGRLPAEKSLVRQGSFRVEGGAIVQPDLVEAERPRAPGRSDAGAAASSGDGVQSVSSEVVLTNADGVIRNSLCVGFDCVNAPAFDDSTVLLAENNTRIKFADTSNAPFPNNDWEIEANSSLAGGLSYLGFNDCGSADNDGGCATDLVFAVEAGARASALYVESDGDVGIGTSNPVLDLHIVTGNTPALRLDQDSSSGFTPQVWDVAGNETNFFVRDATGGSTLPLRIRPGAPSNSVFVDVGGNVGMGTSSPDADLDIEASGPTMKWTNTGAGGGVWDFFVNATTARLNLRFNGANIPFKLDDGANDNLFRVGIDGAGGVAGDTVSIGSDTVDAVLDVRGSIKVDGAVVHADYVFEEDYSLKSIEDQAAFMWENKHLPSLPKAPAGLRGKVDLVGHQMGMLEELEKAHIYIEQLHRDNLDLNRRLESLEQTLQALQALLPPAE